MKKVLFLSILSFVLISMNVSAVETSAPEPKPVTTEITSVVRGFVCDKQTNEALAGAVITANGQKVYSDLDGNFSISNVCDSKCQLKINMISYQEQTLDIDLSKNQPLEIKLKQR